MKRPFALCAVLASLSILRSATLPAQEAAVLRSSETVEVSSSAVSASTGPAAAPLRLTLVYPREGQRYGALSRSFVFGAVEPASATLWINGSTVTPYRTGSYLAMVPFEPGHFRILVRAAFSGQVQEIARTVIISSAPRPLPDLPVTILPETVQPSVLMKLAVGEPVSVQFRGSPGGEAEFRWVEASGRRHGTDWQGMRERSPGEGVYQAVPILRDDSGGKILRAQVRLRKAGGRFVTADGNGLVHVLEEGIAGIGEVTSEDAVLKAGPAMGAEQMGYDLFLPKGTRILLTGQTGQEFRARVSPLYSGWIDEKNLRIGPAQNLPLRAVLDSVRMQDKGPNGGLLTFDLRDRVPVRVQLSDNLKALKLMFYNTVSNIDRIRYEPSSLERWLNRVEWSQDASETVEVQCHLKTEVWGTDLRYDGNRLLVEVLWPPPIRDRSAPLKGLTVAVDPGHSRDPGDGTIGPQGIREDEVNFRFALKLQKRLQERGARAVLTRAAGESVSLPERGRRAFQQRAQLFVSLHANAVPDGANPLERKGYSVFYFQPQSLPLARAVHEAYEKRLGMADDGLYYGNLAVCRMPQMPAILVESGYLIRPDEEEKLLDPEFQGLCAEAIVEGISRFLESRAKP